MDGRSRWRGWLVPWLLGAAMQSGCQLLQPTTTAEPPLAAVPEGAGRLVAQPQPVTDPLTSKPVPVPTVPNSSGQTAYAQVPPPAGMVSQTAYPPSPPPLLPPPVNESPLPTLPPAVRQGPGATITSVDASPPGDGRPLVRPSIGGEIWSTAPGQHPIERLGELTLRLQAKEEEVKKLEARLQQVTTALEQRGQSVGQSTRDVQEATEEIRRTRTALQTTRQEVNDAWNDLRRREKEDIETIKLLLQKLERPGENLPSPGNNDIPAPARP
jgi:hypothetical protein